MEDPKPRREEIECQLVRMLASPIFRKAKSQSRFLSVCVDVTLAGIQPTEREIGKRLLGRKFRKDETTDVRVHAKSLRRTLANYYASQGANDPVVIDFRTPSSNKRIKPPTGEAYRPTFRYNARSVNLESFHSAVEALKAPRSAAQVQWASITFSEVCDKWPDHGQARIAFAEANCVESFLVAPSRQALGLAKQAALSAIDLLPDYWRSYAALGTACCFACEMQAADLAFDVARIIDPDALSLYSGFHMYLSISGRSDLAAKFSAQMLGASHENPFPALLAGIHAYLNRDATAAEVALSEAMNLENNWLVALLDMLIALEQECAPSIAAKYEVFRTIVGDYDSDAIYSGFMAICYHRAQRAQEFEEHIKWTNAFFGNEGLQSKPLSQQALSALVFDESEAWQLFDKAWRDGDPLLLFLDILPIFDPWRNREEFKMLVARSRVPLRERPL
jgi:hypothetical protein